MSTPRRLNLDRHSHDNRHSNSHDVRRSTSNPNRRSQHADPERGHPYPSQSTNNGGNRFLSKTAQGHFVAMTGEFVGTVLFLFFALAATQIANQLSPNGEPGLEQLMFISLAFGFSLATTAWVFYRVSGGLFNPAVTWGMMIAGTLPWVRGLLLFIPQLTGGMVAAALVKCMFPGVMNVQTVLGSGTSIAQGLFIEAALTVELELTILFLAAEKTKATFVAPVAIGLALFVAELAGVFFTGGSLNPVRSFGPCVANRDFPGYHWIYWLGPVLGASVAAGYYRFAKYFEYEDANPGQDASNEGDAEDAKSA